VVNFNAELGNSIGSHQSPIEVQRIVPCNLQFVYDFFKQHTIVADFQIFCLFAGDIRQ
jgi:hypothetical protein